MSAFVTGIVDVLSGLFQGIITSLGGIGNLLFTIDATNNTITGITGFGWFTIVLIGIPLGTWLFSKFLGIFNKLLRK